MNILLNLKNFIQFTDKSFKKLVKTMFKITFLFYSLFILLRIILKKKVRINKNDNIETLSKRVLKQEHKLYPAAIKRLFNYFVWGEGFSGFFVRFGYL